MAKKDVTKWIGIAITVLLILFSVGATIQRNSSKIRSINENGTIPGKKDHDIIIKMEKDVQYIRESMDEVKGYIKENPH